MGWDGGKATAVAALGIEVMGVEGRWVVGMGGQGGGDGSVGDTDGGGGWDTGGGVGWDMDGGVGWDMDGGHGGT